MRGTVGVAAAVAGVDGACRAALAADIADGGRLGWVRFEQTRLGRLTGGGPAPDDRAREPAAVALWVHDAMARTVRGSARGHGMLVSAAWRLAERPVAWSAAELRWALARSRQVLQRYPNGGPDLLVLPLAIAERMAAPDAAAGGAWRWFADRTDLWYTAWEVARVRRRMERLLPPDPGDPYRSLPTRCPLADRLRTDLARWLDRPEVAALLRHCESRPTGPADERRWRADGVPLAAGHAAVLRTIGSTTLAHVPVRYPVIRRGRPATRMTWAEPATMLLLYGVLPTMASMPWPWVEDLLVALGAKTVAVHPARRGRRALLARAARDALVSRGTRTDGVDQLSHRAGHTAAYCYCVDAARCPHP